MDYSIFIYIIFGTFPSLIWLSFYMRKDLHPEPKKMVLKIFLWGALITLPVFFVQIGLSNLLNNISLNPLLRNVIYWFLIIAFSEELFKYLVLKVKVINSPHLDEPVDIMLYAIIAALGFAAVENILYLYVPIGGMSLNQVVNRTLVIDFVRFIGATFLHTLCTAVVGYSMAISFCQAKRKYIYVISGILAAMALHGLYDFSIMTLGGNIRFMIPVVVIFTLATLVFSGFDKLKKMKSTCKIK